MALELTCSGEVFETDASSNIVCVRGGGGRGGEGGRGAILESGQLNSPDEGISVTRTTRLASNDCEARAVGGKALASDELIEHSFDWHHCGEETTTEAVEASDGR